MAGFDLLPSLLSSVFPVPTYFRSVAIPPLLDWSFILLKGCISFPRSSCALFFDTTRLIRSTSSLQPWVRSLELTAPASARLAWRAAPSEGCVRCSSALFLLGAGELCSSRTFLTRSARPQRIAVGAALFSDRIHVRSAGPCRS